MLHSAQNCLHRVIIMLFWCYF